MTTKKMLSVRCCKCGSKAKPVTHDLGPIDYHKKKEELSEDEKTPFKFTTWHCENKKCETDFVISDGTCMKGHYETLQLLSDMTRDYKDTTNELAKIIEDKHKEIEKIVKIVTNYGEMRDDKEKKEKKALDELKKLVDGMKAFWG